MSFWVAKFGGTSIGHLGAMRNCATLVQEKPEIGLVVVSATQNTTNLLEEMASLAQAGEEKKGHLLLHQCAEQHRQMGLDLGLSPQQLEKVKELEEEGKVYLKSLGQGHHSPRELMDSLYALGEKWSSLLFYGTLLPYFGEGRIQLRDARQFVKTDSQFGRANPCLEEIQCHCQRELRELLQKSLVVTQGFIGSNFQQETTTLGREGSNYSVTLLAAALGASGVQIWTDVAGIFSADPKLVPSAQVIDKMHYDEAAAMAERGAKIFFPQMIEPLRHLEIPLFVGPSQRPMLGGTLISNQKKGTGPKTLCLQEKEGQTFLNVIGHALEDISFDLPEVERGEYYRCFRIEEGMEAVNKLKQWHKRLFE